MFGFQHSLFGCHVEISETHGKSCHALWMLEKPSISRDALSWFPPMVKKLLNIEQLHAPHLIFGSSKRPVQMFGSCVTIPTKRCEFGL